MRGEIDVNHRGHTTGWRVWPERTTWKWHAFGPVRSESGTCDSRDEAMSEANTAEGHLTPIARAQTPIQGASA
jgi:hypothetical protein